jgi:hypothetical protein
MRRALLALLAATVALPALADSAPTLLPGTMPSLSQGRPSAQRFAPAPVPNPDISAPRGHHDPNAVQISPGLTRTNTGRALSGDGFTPGSAYSGELERRNGRAGLGTTLAPSVNMKVPVQVEFEARRR